MIRANLMTVGWLCYTAVNIAQTTHSPLGAYHFTTGAYSKHFQDAFSMMANAGALSSLGYFSIGVNGEQRFMLQQTGVYTAVATLPLNTGNLGLQADYSGYDDFNESQIGLGYGLQLNESIGIGAKFNYYHFRIPSYISSSSVNFEIGTMVHISDQLHTGVSVYNPLESPLGKNTGERLAAVYKAGIGYEWSSSFFTQLEIIKEKGRDINIHLGIQYKPLEQVLARAGVQTGNNAIYFGAGYLYRRFRMDVSVSLHQQLGMSPGIMLLYQLKKNEE